MSQTKNWNLTIWNLWNKVLNLESETFYQLKMVELNIKVTVEKLCQ